MPSNRAAILTPSPIRSPSLSSTTSPRWTPMRKSIRRSSGTPALRSTIAFCTSMAQRTASTTLRNSTSAPSPVRLTTRPLCTAIVGSIRSLRNARNRAKVRSSSAPLRRLNPTTSAARIAASLRFSVIVPQPLWRIAQRARQCRSRYRARSGRTRRVGCGAALRMRGLSHQQDDPCAVRLRPQHW